MAATARQQRDLIEKYQHRKKTAKSPLDLLQAHCLSQGVNGIRALGRAFKRLDQDRNHRVNQAEFRNALRVACISLNREDETALFHLIDKDNDGCINFDEFLVALRPPMSQHRRSLITEAYNKLDKNADGKVTTDDLKGVYSAKKHPKFLNGEWTEEDVFRSFLDTFDTGNKDGIVTKEEFENYYVGVSASIDSDAYFDLMMRQAWKL